MQRSNRQQRCRSMSGWALALTLAGALAGRAAHAQIAVQLRSERDTFMVYESIPVEINVHNFSGRNLDSAAAGKEPWLDFLVMDESGSRIAPLGEIKNSDTVLIPPGQTVTRTVDLLPLYDLRARGYFQVQAIVSYGGKQFHSTPLKFVIENGQEIWSQTVGLPVVGTAPDQYRTYRLEVGKITGHDALYVCIQDEPHELVYAMMSLGSYLPMGAPNVKVDPKAHLHVLFRTTPRAFTYVHLDPDGRLIRRAVYSDVLSRPELVTALDSSVSVRGGEQIYPKPERVMADSELLPQVPPPPPAKAKRGHAAPTKPAGTTPSTAVTEPVSSQTRTNGPTTNFSPK